MSDWSDLEDEASADGNRRYRCSVGELIRATREEVGEDEAYAIVHALKNHRLSTPSIRRALQRRVEPDLLPSAWMLGHHRRGNCSCREES